MSTPTRVGGALAAGYFLGRFKKLRLALLVGSAMANKDLRDKGRNLLSRGTQGIASTPEGTQLRHQISDQLLEAGRAAAVTAASSRIDRLSDRLEERRASLRRNRAADEDEAEDEYDEEAEAEAEGEEPEPEDEYDEEPEAEGEEAEPEDEYAEDEEPEPEDEYDEEPEPRDEALPTVPAPRSSTRGRRFAPARGRR